MIYQKNGGKIVLNFEADKFVECTDPEYPLKIISKNNVKLIRTFLN